MMLAVSTPPLGVWKSRTITACAPPLAKKSRTAYPSV